MMSAPLRVGIALVCLLIAGRTASAQAVPSDEIVGKLFNVLFAAGLGESSPAA